MAGIMRRAVVLLCALVFVLSNLHSTQAQYGIGDYDDVPFRPPTPKNPLQINKPVNWTSIVKAECPTDCVACCTASWDQLAWVMLTMPKGNCSFCDVIKYSAGKLIYDDSMMTCQQCLMDDFKQVVTNFRCNNDNGKCSKCCMDLTLIYIARFVMACERRVWRMVLAMNYADTGFIYDGSSTCPSFGPGAPPSPEEAFYRVDWPKKVGETKQPQQQQGPGPVYYDYHYLEVNQLAEDVAFGG